MYISQILERASKRQKPVFSFEFFPPKTKETVEHLRHTIRALKPLEPDFCSVTYGAFGSTRDLTLDLVSEIKHDIGIEAMAHIAAIDNSQQEIEKLLNLIDRKSTRLNSSH